MNTKDLLNNLREEYHGNTSPCFFNGVYVGTCYWFSNDFYVLKASYDKNSKICWIKPAGRKTSDRKRKNGNFYKVNEWIFELYGYDPDDNKYITDLSFSEAVKMVERYMFNPIISSK